MVPVTLEFGDYFTVDTDTFVADTLGDRSDQLTESLAEFLADDDRRGHTSDIMAWLDTLDRDDDDDDGEAPVWSGVYGEGEPWSVYSGNGESFLTTEIFTILAYSRWRGLVIIGHADAYGVHGDYDVFEVSGPGDEHLTILDTGRLTAMCTAGHVSDSDSAGYDWSPSNGGDGGYWTSSNVRLDAMVRSYDPDGIDHDMEYVECPAPDCYHAVTVWTS